MENHRFLEGKVALVTGGSRGIGRATALALAEVGASVAINYHHCKEAADEVTRPGAQYGGKAGAYQANVSHSDDCDAMVNSVASDFGRVDILVNNAGSPATRAF